MHVRTSSTCPFSSRTTSSFLSAGGGVFVSAILLSCTRAGGPSTRFLAYAPQHAPFPPLKREANGRPMAPAMLALPDGVYFPTSAGIEMCIDAYMNQVGQRQRA